MASFSESKAVRKEFAHIAEHCLENWREMPENVPPSWDYVEALLDVQAQSARDLREAEKRADDAERKQGADRERLEELREELKRLRRENAELRGEKAEAERRARSGEPRPAPAPEATRVEELERRLRKAEKENEHLHREIERLSAVAGDALGPEPVPEPGPVPARVPVSDAEPSDNSIASDLNPRRRVIRQMLRKLVKKGKIGAAHTHEDNVYRGVADHEKGIAKDAIDLLYREGFLMPKPTATDPHVSISPERMAEVRGIIAGRVENARLLRFLEA
jgi:chaperonin cofactor prefoldin